jgi:KipI family sensor histidine kinase inhibitor
VRRLVVGRRALLVELDGDRDVTSAYRQIRTLTDAGRLPPARDVVPAARTVLVDGVDPDVWWQAFEAAVDLTMAADDCPEDSDRVTVVVHYDGADLEEVARQWGCETDEVVRRHQEAVFTVAFCGFAPGFAYCTSEPALPEVTRRDDPRTKVPAGSVGLAWRYCGVYPNAMPGGWQLIGKTDEVMFDVERDQPALLVPGMRLQFRDGDGASTT